MNDIVKILKGVAFAESQDVADRFDKKHKNVLATIDRIIGDLTTVQAAVNDYFIKGNFINARNREYRNFLMTREGFALVAMTLEGTDSMKFKIQFIDAFKMMERRLKEDYALEKLSKETRKLLTASVDESGENERMHGYGFSNYTKLAYKIIGVKYIKPKKGIRFRDSLDSETVERLVDVESIMKSLLKAGKQYEDVKRTVCDVFGEPKKIIKG
jgi:Rha family phage regulatory protein